MPRIKITGSEPSKGGNWEPLPKGDYYLEIESADEDVAGTGAAQLKVVSVVVDGEYAGQSLTQYYITDNPKAGFKIRGLVEAAIPDKCDVVDTGNVDDKGRAIADVDFDSDDLIGARYYASVGQEAVQGKDYMRNNIFSFRSEAEMSGAEPADEEPADEEPAAPPARRNNAPTPKAPPTRAAAPAPTRAAAPARTATPTRTAAPARAAAPTRERRRLNG